MANFFTTNTKSNGNTDEKLLTITMHNLVDNYITKEQYFGLKILFFCFSSVPIK